LPDLTDEQIERQIQYCLNNGWSLGIEYTDDPHPRNSLWEVWGLPMFDVIDPRAIMHALDACRKVLPNHYIKIIANNSTRGRETVALSFIVHRPAQEPGFRLDRQEASGRTVHYALHSYAADRPSGTRYKRD
jgi:ribulose-bisphosphate carboxylase small chain